VGYERCEIRREVTPSDLGTMPHGDTCKLDTDLQFYLDLFPFGSYLLMPPCAEMQITDWDFHDELSDQYILIETLLKNQLPCDFFEWIILQISLNNFNFCR
jgi:hypothetical protein